MEGCVRGRHVRWFVRIQDISWTALAAGGHSVCGPIHQVPSNGLSQRAPRETGPHAELTEGLPLGLLRPPRDVHGLRRLRGYVKPRRVPVGHIHQVFASKNLSRRFSLAVHFLGMRREQQSVEFSDAPRWVHGLERDERVL